MELTRPLYPVLEGTLSIQDNSGNQEFLDHFPVFHEPIISLMKNHFKTTRNNNPLILDCTLGAGNLSLEMLKAFPYSSLYFS